MHTSSTKRWIINSEIPHEIEQNLHPFSPILRRILYSRGYQSIESANSYLNASPPAGCLPENLTGIGVAVDRIWSSIEKQEPIAIYGDYDADGVTATALLTDVLQRLGAVVMGYIPNRFDEGYGLNTDALDSLEAQGIRLVVTVDCGVRSLDEVEHARNIGIDIIITDHHQPAVQLPRAVAIVNPKQPDDNYPDKNLAGVGLAYKLASALLEKAGFKPPSNSYPSPAIDYLDLVALGTVADQAPLIGENRSLVRTGLEYLRIPNRQGVRSLIGAAQLNPDSINAESIGFILAPRLNAAGRLESALSALDLLLTRDVGKAARLAQLLDTQNRERQEITKAIQAHAEETVFAAGLDQVLLFAVNESYNPGVIGLAASRLTEKFYRPAIVASKGEEFTRGSCRSIPEFHITEALDQCSDLLVRHGGHSAAAGFTVQNQKLQELADRLDLIAQDKLGSLDLQPRLHADAVVELSELTPGLLRELSYLEPTGSGNPSALFISRNLRVLRSRAVGKDASHLKLAVTDGKITYDVIAFRLGHLLGDLPLHIDLCFAFELNEYNGNSILQLNAKDIHPASGPAAYF